MDKYRESANEAEKLTNTSPTENQKISGNYKKGSFNLHGMKVTIENPQNSTRSGKDDNGNEWSNTMYNTYGYFNNSIGRDGDHIDVFLGDDLESGRIFVIDQINPDKSFDEHKVMFGFKSKKDARLAYLSNYNQGWKGFGNITEVSIDSLKKWITNKGKRNKPFNQLRGFWSMENTDEVGKLKKVKLYGVIEYDKAYKKFVKDVGDISKFDTLMIDIRSPGGAVKDGLEISAFLHNLSINENKLIVTAVTANADSIASIIAVIGDIRLISNHGRIMVHNPMTPSMEYANAEELEEEAKSLRQLEESMVEIYRLFTGLDSEKIKQIMDEETFMKPEQAIKWGFSDEIVEMKKEDMVMTSTKTKLSKEMKRVNALKRVAASLTGKEFVDQSYNTLEGYKIEIYQKDPTQYKTGDRTNKKSGEFKLSDGKILTVEDGAITEIKSAEIPKVDANVGAAPTDPIALAKAKVEEAQAALAAAMEAEKEPVPVDKVEKGVIPTEAVEKPVEAVEKPVEPIVKAPEGIEPTKEPVAPAKPAEPTEPTEPAVEPVEPAVAPVEPVVPTEPAVPVSEPTEPAVPVEPAVEPVVTPSTEPVTEPTVEPVEPVVEPGTKPVEPATEPVVEPVEPGMEPVVEPVAPGTEPIVEPTGPITRDEFNTLIEILTPITEFFKTMPVSELVSKNKDFIALTESVGELGKMINQNLEKSNKFEELTTEVIEQIASSTKSSWEPDMRNNSDLPKATKPSGSIFQRMRDHQLAASK